MAKGISKDATDTMGATGAKGTSEITVKDVAALMVKGAGTVMGLAEGQLAKAIKERGGSQAMAFPETAFYLPLANALLCAEVMTLDDAAKVLETAKTLIPPASGTDKDDITLKKALDAGVGTVLSAEVLCALGYLNGTEPQADCPGFFSDTILRALGIQLVDGRISGIAVVMGRAPDAATAVEIVRGLQSVIYSRSSATASTASAS